MNNFFQFLLRLVVIGGLSMVFIMAIIFLNPSKVHRRRKISTPLMKISYLLYLAIFLVFIYVLIFTNRNFQDYFNESNYTLAVFAGLFPTTGMLLRRKIKHFRITYNYFLSIVHILIVFFLIKFLIQVLVFM